MTKFWLFKLVIPRAGPMEQWPRASTGVPPPVVTSLPPGTNCGEVIKTNKSGSFRFPGYPTHRRQDNCTFVIEIPRGYGFEITFPSIPIGSRFVRK